MVKSEKQLKTLLNDLRMELQDLYGDGLVSLKLFGSYARGEADDDSDIDIAVELKTMTNRFKERERTSRIRAKHSIANGCVINLFFLTQDELAEKEYALHRTISSEAQPV